MLGSIQFTELKISVCVCTAFKHSTNTTPGFTHSSQVVNIHIHGWCLLAMAWGPCILCEYMHLAANPLHNMVSVATVCLVSQWFELVAHFVSSRCTYKAQDVYSVSICTAYCRLPQVLALNSTQPSSNSSFTAVYRATCASHQCQGVVNCPPTLQYNRDVM